MAASKVSAHRVVTRTGGRRRPMSAMAIKVQADVHAGGDGAVFGGVQVGNVSRFGAERGHKAEGSEGGGGPGVFAVKLGRGGENEDGAAGVSFAGGQREMEAAAGVRGVDGDRRGRRAQGVVVGRVKLVGQADSIAGAAEHLKRA